MLNRDGTLWFRGSLGNRNAEMFVPAVMRTIPSSSLISCASNYYIIHDGGDLYYCTDEEKLRMDFKYSPIEQQSLSMASANNFTIFYGKRKKFS